MTLIDRLSAATGPDRVLADEVLLACGWVYVGNRDHAWYPSQAHADHNAEPCYADDDQPNPLASLDAALTLVPEGWTYHIMWQQVSTKENPFCSADAWANKHGHPAEVSKQDVRNVQGATPAIALTIAALRARGVEG